ncbi:LRR receptor-like serine/threonine-protein kinase [Pyrus ussuriensis x Pyrus communis]|uniref:non-specific serine/threonine protein kinase n=1 Tax=Pyrus ussuriensis x Pyrus communis TaxID=2448454 RepID=A0A5N5GMM7_9ROSA|nr:LRR receptor-like serine/threonine-protein kinase [Pyrus ussuriensis x Pyrus communis]
MSNLDANYIATSLNITGPDLYRTARIALLSLKYYGLCMLKGNYKLRLYFSEIMFTDDQTFSNLGKRLFDISIQGNLVLKDINIMEEARGVGKGIVREFDNVTVIGSTLEIHLYWVGKGTTAIPYTSVYGPLISAISVTLNLKGVELQTRKFTFTQLKDATTNFDQSNKIGEGGFGTVYKICINYLSQIHGILVDGTLIAVKQLSSKSKQGNREFVNEIGMISALQHPHLVNLYGCCIDGNQLYLVYEHMENNSVSHALFGAEESQLKLDWPTRHNICVGIAKGLAYLHEESSLKVIHRDIKATNVLLDTHLNPKISDFGLAKLAEEDKTHISTRAAGTFGYMTPEYALRGHLTDKADVYSFGIVVLEIISGKKNSTQQTNAEGFYILDWAHVLKSEGNLMNLVDPKLSTEFNNEEIMATINVALHCCNSTSKLRPTMSAVVSMLEGKVAVEEFVLDPNPSTSDEMDPMVKKLFQFCLRRGAGSVERLSDDSFAAFDDIHPFNPHSDTNSLSSHSATPIPSARPIRVE